MNFYKKLGLYYDVFFPFNPVQLAFLKEGLKAEDRILDIGCATGSYAIPLAEAGYAVFAFDLDAQMVAQLKAKSQGKGLPLEAWVMDMRQVSQVQQGPFDFIYNIGNTLVHLENDLEVTNCLKACREHLEEHGRLLIQVVNYDRILKDQMTHLPLIEREAGALTFERTYALMGEVVLFTGTLKDHEHTWTAESRLLCLTKERLATCLVAAGYSQFEFLGDFKGGPWHVDSPATIALATK